MFTVPKRAQTISTICKNRKDFGAEPFKRVYVRAEGENTIIVTTNGFVLIELTTPNRAADFPELPNLPNENGSNHVLITAEEWNTILKSLPTKAIYPILGYALIVPQKRQGAVVGITDLQSTKIIQTKEMDVWKTDKETKKETEEEITERFPEYEHILSDPKNDTIQEISLDPALTAKIFQVLANMEFKSVTLKINKNPEITILIEGKNNHGDHVRAALMPLEKN